VRHLAEDKFRIKRHAVLFQQGDELFFESTLLVMILLISYVLNDNRDM
jgi:hypothetical protein